MAPVRVSDAVISGCCGLREMNVVIVNNEKKEEKKSCVDVHSV